MKIARLAEKLTARERQAIAREGFRPSAVLVPIVVEEGLPARLIFTVRHAGLRSHAGQIAFPGGARDGGDADLTATALREAEEELGIAPASVRPLGLLDDVPTPTGFVITPVVATVPGPLALRPAAAEVAEAFLAEVSGLADPACHSIDGEREWQGVRYPMHQYRWRDWNIWGATARILHQLLVLIGDSGSGMDRSPEEAP